MATQRGPKIVRSGLVLHLDAADRKSYPGSGNSFYDLSGNNNHWTIDASGFTFNSAGYFSMADGGITKTSSSALFSTALSNTFVFWIKTTDIQALFLRGLAGGNYYVGAYRSDSVGYAGGVTTSSLYIDCRYIATYDLYNNVRDNRWHMVEFKGNEGLNNWGNLAFNKYSGYTFGDGALASLSIYNKVLTANESLQNFNSFRGRFGV